MLRGFINTKISYKEKISFLATFLYYFTNLFLFRSKMYPPPFLENKQNFNPHCLCNVGEIQLWLIKTICFIYLLLQTKLIIIKTFNLKFKKYHLLNFQKILMIRHFTNKVIINLKWRKCNSFFKSLLKENIKYTKSLNFLLNFIISFYFEELHSDTA